MLQNLEAEDASLSLQPVQRLIARVMEVPDDRPIPASLDFIARRDRARQSWEAFARTPAFAEALGRDLVEDPEEALPPMKPDDRGRELLIEATNAPAPGA